MNIIDLLRAKSTVASIVHANVLLPDGRSLNGLFQQGDYDDIIAHLQTGVATRAPYEGMALITAGDPEGSAFYLQCRSGLMAGQFSASELEIIADWINGLSSAGTLLELNNSEYAVLYKIASYIGKHWGFEEYLMNQNAFRTVLQTKLVAEDNPDWEAPPISYTKYYKNAIALLEELESQLPADEAMAKLFHLPELGENPSESPFWSTPLGQVRKFVLNEFANLLMRMGGYQAFGFQNYRGAIQSKTIEQMNQTGEWSYNLYKGVEE